LGENGISIWKKAQGFDHSPVEQYSERKSISKERTFDQDTIDVVKLRSVLAAMAENMAFQLRTSNKLTACVTLKIRYADFQTQTLQKQIPYTAADHDLFPIATDLFNRLFQRRMLVRLIGLRYSSLVAGNHQLSLFDESVDYASLYRSLDHIRKRYGDRAVMRAIGMNVTRID
jgi:DNA polymerase-4